MVTTRRQEQLLHTPPAAGRGSFADASPATPADGSGPPPTARLPLKSALKQKRLAADGWEEDGTPVDAGIKKRVRIHSSNNMVRIFSTSHSALSPQDSPQGHGVHSLPLSHSDDDGTPQSGRPRRRRPPPRKSPLAVRLLARAFGWRSSRRSSSSSESLVLGVLFTLSWMAASSALIFANKRLMVDAGFRFPFALTAMGQATSTLLGELYAWGVVLMSRKVLHCEHSKACRRICKGSAFVLPTLPPCLALPQPLPHAWRASRPCDRPRRAAPCSPSCCPCRSALRRRCSWAM